MRRRRRRDVQIIGVAMAVALLAALPAGAQTGSGRISGIVKDQTGAVVPGVTILAVHEETGIRHATVTTDSGLFLFASLPVGPTQSARSSRVSRR